MEDYTTTTAFSCRNINLTFSYKYVILTNKKAALIQVNKIDGNKVY